MGSHNSRPTNPNQTPIVIDENRIYRPRVRTVNIQPIFEPGEEDLIPDISTTNALPFPMTDRWKRNWLQQHKTGIQRLIELLKSTSTTLSQLLNMLKKVVPEEFVSETRPNLASLINFIVFFLMFSIGKGPYLLLYPSGRKLILDVFVGNSAHPVSRGTAIVSFLKLVRALYFLRPSIGVPDDLIARWVIQIYQMLPISLQQSLTGIGVTDVMLSRVAFKEFYNRLFTAAANPPLARILPSPAPTSALSVLSQPYRLPF